MVNQHLAKSTRRQLQIYYNAAADASLLHYAAALRHLNAPGPFVLMHLRRQLAITHGNAPGVRKTHSCALATLTAATVPNGIALFTS